MYVCMYVCMYVHSMYVCICVCGGGIHHTLMIYIHVVLLGLVYSAAIVRRQI